MVSAQCDHFVAVSIFKVGYMVMGPKCLRASATHVPLTETSIEQYISKHTVVIEIKR